MPRLVLLGPRLFKIVSADRTKMSILMLANRTISYISHSLLKGTHQPEEVTIVRTSIFYQSVGVPNNGDELKMCSQSEVAPGPQPTIHRFLSRAAPPPLS